MINFFNFKKMGNDILITNDYGNYVFLQADEFRQLLNHTLPTDSHCYQDLVDKHFIIEGISDLISPEIIDGLRDAKNYVFSATSLHIIVVTNSCNLSCIYCQAKQVETGQCGFMSPEIACKSVDVALQSPAAHITLEFQGGEPLLNYPAIKAAIEHCELNKGTKGVDYTIVSNLVALTDQQLSFFKVHHVMISTSFDGPEYVHDHNRRISGINSSYSFVINGIERLRNYGILSGAIQTTTKYSLKYPIEIVDAYAKQQLPGIFLRPLSPLGIAQKHWSEVGYTAEEFLDFYKIAFHHILEINYSGIVFPEFYATYLLKKIFNHYGYNYMELRSPCGAALGQLCYYYDGSVYTCDEGRMVAESGDYAFKLGTVFHDNYNHLIQSEAAHSTCSASITECIPGCCDCVYQPFCGVCPVVTYASEHDLLSKNAGNYRCTIQKGILDLLFELLHSGDSKTIKCLKSWTGDKI